MTGDRTPDRDVIMQFLEAPGGSGQERVLSEHPQLLDDAHQAFLAMLHLTAQERDPAWAQTIDRSRRVLAWRRSNPPSAPVTPGRVAAISIPPELDDAFKALASSGPMVACRDHRELLGQQAGELLRALYREATTVRDAETAAIVERVLRAIDATRVARASLALEDVSGRDVPSATLDGVDAMLAAPDWRSAVKTIERHPSLLGNECASLWLFLLAYTWENGDPHAVTTYFEQWRFLSAARAFGPDQALAQWAGWAGVLSEELRQRFGHAQELAAQAVRTDEPVALREASDACEQLLRQLGETPVPSMFRADLLLAAGGTALALERQDPSPERLERAIDRARAALACVNPPAPGREVCLINLGRALQRRSETTGDVNDQRAAVEAFCDAAEAATLFSKLRPEIIATASSALERLANITGEQAPLDRGVALLAKEVQLAGPYPVGRAYAAVLLGLAYFNRYMRTGDSASLDTAIDALQAEADRIDVPFPRAAVMHQLGHLVFRRYMARGGTDDLKRAREILEDAVATARPGSAVRSMALDHLGSVWQETYRRSGRLEDIERAIALAEDAVSQLDDERVPGGLSAANLANSLLLRYDLVGDRQDLERAVDLCEDDVATNPHDAEYVIGLISLGTAFRFAYQRHGNIDLLDRAVDLLDRAFDLAGAKSPMHRYAASNLVTALFLRQRLMEDPEDVDRIVDLSEQVVAADAPGAPRRAGSLGNLGAALMLRGSDRDVDVAIETLERSVEEAVDGTDQDHVHRSNLAGALITRGDREDVDRAIELLEPVLALSAPGSFERTRRLLLLGDAYVRRRGPGDRERAAPAFREASGAGITSWPELALVAAREWSRDAAESEAWDEAAEAADAGLRAMRELFRVQLFRPHKELWIGEGHGQASLAAYAHCRRDRFLDAATALEAGRGLLLREALERDRADVDALARSGHDELAQRYGAAVARSDALVAAAGLDDAPGP